MTFLKKKEVKIGNNDERPTFIDSLLLEIEQQDPNINEPPFPVRKNEAKIDDMTTYERRVWSLKQKFAMETEHAVLRSKYLPNVKDDHELHKQIDILNQKSNLVTNLLFSIIIDRIPHQCGKSVSIRQGWILVSEKEPRMHPLARLFGSGGGDDDD